MRWLSFRRADHPTAGDGGFLNWLRALPRWARLSLAACAALLVWYGVIGGIRAGIHAEPASRPGPTLLPPGGAETVAMAALLVEQQIHDRAFTPNDPFFYPTGFTRRTPAFQARVVEAVADAVSTLASDGRSPLLTSAAQSLATPADQWLLGRRFPFVARPAEVHYRRAVEALVRHNSEIAATSSARRQLASAALTAMLVSLLEAEAQAIADHRRDRSRERDSTRLAGARGTALAATMLLRGVREDGAESIRVSGRAARWAEAIDALDSVARLDPLIVRDSHLVEAGYSLLLASRALRDILAADA
jgi:hypothetical protein